MRGQEDGKGAAALTISSLADHVEDHVALHQISSEEAVIPVQTSSWSREADVVLDEIVVGERLEIAAGLLHVHAYCVHHAPSNGVLAWVFRGAAIVEAARADRQNRAVARPPEVAVNDLAALDMVGQKHAVALELIKADA